MIIAYLTHHIVYNSIVDELRMTSAPKKKKVIWNLTLPAQFSLPTQTKVKFPTPRAQKVASLMPEICPGKEGEGGCWILNLIGALLWRRHFFKQYNCDRIDFKIKDVNKNSFFRKTVILMFCGINRSLQLFAFMSSNRLRNLFCSTTSKLSQSVAGYSPKTSKFQVINISANLNGLTQIKIKRRNR